VISHPPDAADYFLLLLCVRIKLFRCRFVPLLGPNPGNFILSQDQTPLSARSLRSLGFPKSGSPTSANEHTFAGSTARLCHHSLSDSTQFAGNLFTALLLDNVDDALCERPRSTETQSTRCTVGGVI